MESECNIVGKTGRKMKIKFYKKKYNSVFFIEAVFFMKFCNESAPRIITLRYIWCDEFDFGKRMFD